MEEKLIKVLLVENDPEVIEAFPGEAYEYGIHLVPFTNWDEAELALKEDFEQWSAIILDAKCCLHADSPDNAAVFLTNVSNAITLLCRGKKFIPWYVLSGQAEDNIKDLIPESRKSWDGDWKKPYYDKNTDRDILYHRIKNAARKFKSSCMKIHEMYKEVFDSIDHLKLHDEVDNYLTDLLVELHFPELDDKHLNENYEKVRKCIEYIFRKMIEIGMLPYQKKINLTWSNKILSGMPVNAKDGTEVARGVIAVLPQILQDNIIHMIHTAGSALHTDEEKDTDTKHVKDYLSSVGNSSFLIKSYALQICDLILWLNNFAEENPDKEANSRNWEIWDEKKFR